MTRFVPWLIALGLFAVAGVVVALEPGEQTSQGPFVTEVALDEHGLGRNIEATIRDVRLADVVDLDTLDGWHGTTEGVWVVAEVTAASRLENQGLTSFLLIGDLKFTGSERMEYDGLESAILSPGIPTTGTVLFEIPRELAETTTSARVMIGLNRDWRLDSVIGTTVDLSALTVEPEITVSANAKVAP